ncbi:MAG: hypothetical protein ACOYOV_00400 [Bacteroidales bacterium]
MKTCRLCHQDKDISEFKIRTDTKKPRSECRICCNLKYKILNKNRQDKQKEYGKQYYQEHKEEIKASTNQYRADNKESIREYKRKYQTHRRNTDPVFAMKARIRSRIKAALTYRFWKKTTKFNEYIGCSNEEFKAHIESHFTEGMSWSNRSLWHLDHKMPLDYAKTEEEMMELCHFLNLQPLWGAENCSKNNKVTDEGYAAIAQVREFKRSRAEKV